ncbi:MAG TPA: FGGY-family carbohydrate kinase [Aliidongia sp.]|uniref:FGGY-family carbohydrate kinase n=1 Tax=Aliidongia sp. TaxID=1914230 RepID=UPI002DDDBC7D|nr:FGGY-family carbohydrate kinase [Aliidongia sp.]HEV2677691.1 FGGY-family carbohydrate kinase [Aliidongia sp.]
MPDRDTIIALDAGTTTLKAVAFAWTGEELAACSAANRLRYGGDGAVEQDMAQTWTSCLALLHRLLDDRADLRNRVAALAVTGQGDGTWLIDAAGSPVGPALTWLDGRAAETIRALSPATIHDIEAITGTALNPSLQSVQLAWLQRHQPERLTRSAAALHCKDWLHFRLTGMVASDLTETMFTYGDVAAGTLDGRVADLLGIPKAARLVPAMRRPLADRAALDGAVARDLSLPEGLPVVLAPIDVVCSALGAGAIDGNGLHACSIFGSAGVHLRLEPGSPVVPNPVAGYTTHLAPGALSVRYLSNMAASLNLDWLDELVAQAAALFDAHGSAQKSRTERLAALDRLAMTGRSATLLYFPYLFPGGERAPFVNPDARAQFVGLRRDHTLADLVVAVYEGIAFAAKDCHLRLGRPSEIRLSGGLARSERFQQILTDVLGVPTRHCLCEETGAAGAAMVAAVNLGFFGTLAHAGDAWTGSRLTPPRPPDPKRSGTYDTMFEIYRAVATASSPAWSALRQLDGGTQP